jgi:predicted  nucleic acid-binding Zn-ribbon protein
MSFSNDTVKLVITVGERQNTMSDIVKDFLFKLGDQTELITETLSLFEKQYEKMQVEIDYLNERLDQAEQELANLKTESRRLKRTSIKDLENTLELLHKRRRTLCPWDQELPVTKS